MLILIKFILFFCASFLQANSDFALVNQLCVSFKDNILTLQKIKQVAAAQNITNKQAQELLLKQNILFSYAEKELLLDKERVKKQAIDYTQKIMNENKVNQSQFNEILQKHHNSDYESYIQNISYMILLEQVKSRIISSLVINEQQKKQAISEYLEKNSQKTEIIFVSSKNKILLENIKKEFGNISYKALKNKYKNNNNVTFSHPILYTEGSLLPVYENALLQAPNSLILGPFLENNGSQTIILKNITKNAKAKMTKDLQDSIVSALKEKLAQNKIENIVSNELNNSQLIYNCTL